MENLKNPKGWQKSNTLILSNIIFLYFKNAVTKFKNIHFKDPEINNEVFLKIFVLPMSSWFFCVKIDSIKTAFFQLTFKFVNWYNILQQSIPSKLIPPFVSVRIIIASPVFWSFQQICSQGFTRKILFSFRRFYGSHVYIIQHYFGGNKRSVQSWDGKPQHHSR